MALPLSPPLIGRRCPPLPSRRCAAGIHRHPGPLRMAQAKLTSVHMPLHTVAEWRVDVVLLSETRLTVVTQQVMRAQAGASRWPAF